MLRWGTGRARIVLAALMLAGPVLAGSSSPVTAQAASTAEVRPDLARFFDRHGARGTFVLYDDARDHWIRYAPARAAERFLPASTFKIFNSLVVLDVGAIADDAQVIPWDSVDRGLAIWNRDQTLRTAFRRSAVWVYQRLARQVGEPRMAAFVRREHYGNEDIGGGIDRFWLTGELRISADEQVRFLRRLHSGDLGFSPRSMAIVRSIMVLDSTAAYTLRGKTGLARPPGTEGSGVGWLVGWVERDGDPFFFALNLDGPAPDLPMGEARHEIAYGILRELGVLPPDAPQISRRPTSSPASSSATTP